MNTQLAVNTMARLQNVKAIGFDLGETLLFYPGVGLSWTDHYPNALSAVSEKCQFSPSAADISQACAILKRFNTRENPREEEVPSDQIFKLIVEAWGLDPSKYLSNAVDAFFAYFQRNARAYNDSNEVISKLKGKGLKLGVLTDVPYGMPAPFVKNDLVSAGILAGIDAVVTSTDAGFRKPHVAPYLRLAERLDVRPAEMVYIGNEEKDMRGARSAGMISILVNRGKRESNFGQDFTLTNLSGIFEIIEL